MRVKIIRHGKVDMNWKKRYTSAEYDTVWDRYDEMDIFPIPADRHTEIYPSGRVYVTDMKRTHQTAKQYLGTGDFTVLPGMMNEVPLKPFIRSRIPLHKRIFDIIGRIQWYIPWSRQPETRRGTYRRCDELIRFLEEKDEDCVLVLHGFFMHALLGAFKKHGYVLDRKPIVIRNLCTVEAVKDEFKQNAG